MEQVVRRNLLRSPRKCGFLSIICTQKPVIRLERSNCPNRKMMDGQLFMPLIVSQEDLFQTPGLQEEMQNIIDSLDTSIPDTICILFCENNVLK